MELATFERLARYFYEVKFMAKFSLRSKSVLLWPPALKTTRPATTNPPDLVLSNIHTIFSFFLLPGDTALRALIPFDFLWDSVAKVERNPSSNHLTIPPEISKLTTNNRTLHRYVLEVLFFFFVDGYGCLSSIK